MATSCRVCKNSTDIFCYVCGEYCPKWSEKRIIKLDAKFSQAYRAYFGVKVCDQYVDVCDDFAGWIDGKNRRMKFAVPRIWREPRNHHDDCYFLRGGCHAIQRKVAN
ncbi:Uncharacterised protein r2_g376 [Pycnogonum litorale]